MRLPDIGGQSRIAHETQVQFAGLDHNIGAQDGSLWDMSNLTGVFF